MIKFRQIQMLLANAAQIIPHLLFGLWYYLYCRLSRFLNTCFLVQGFFTCYYNILSLLFGKGQQLQWKTHWQSPQCRDILSRRNYLTRSKKLILNSIYCFIIAMCLLIDIQVCYLSSVFGKFSRTVWYAEVVGCTLFLLNSSFAVMFYFSCKLSKPIPISPSQQKMFGICDNDPGFIIKKHEEDIAETIKPKSLQFSSFRSADSSISPSCMSITPINLSCSSWASDSPSALETTSSSFSFYRASSPTQYSSTPKGPNNKKNSSWRQLSFTDNIESPYERPIKNKKHLEEFLKLQEEEEKKKHSVSLEENKGFMTTVNSSPMSVLSKCLYQRSYRLPNAETLEDEISESHGGDGVLLKLKITDKMLVTWCEHVRKWICQTILVKLVREVEDINFTLTELGLPEFQIGNISLSTLHQLSVSKAQHLPTLSLVLPYFDTFSNQEYVVRRLKDLARGGCIGDFKWNAGATYEDKRWGDDMPTDSTLIMHILCCYFDAHLPPDAHFPEGKPFSSKYFRKVPEKLVVSKDLVYIYQSVLNPPQFKVVMGEDVYTAQKGRNNLFFALVVFLYYIKIKHCGMLGHVNLGPSGLNILWVVD